MATLCKEQCKDNKIAYRLVFSDGNGKRRSLRLGKMPKKAAETVKSHVEEIISCRLAGRSLTAETSDWLGKLPDDTLAKLAKAELVTFQRHTLGELLEAFRKQKSGVKQSTLDVYDYTEHRLFSYFDRTTPLRRLLPEDFEKWKTFLQTDYRSPRTGKALVEATVAGAVTKMKAVFNWAIKDKWITKEQNPLAGVGRGSFASRGKFREVTMDEYYRLLATCPCQEWRVIIALARIGGLRPSEILRLRWVDVVWLKSRFLVTSTKTERYQGKEKRYVPLFRLLWIELERLAECESSKGKEFVINRYRDPEHSNMRHQFSLIVKKAGLEPIPRPFDSMREIRSTEIYNAFGAVKESEWIGHSTKIAKDCYIKVLESDYELAAKWEGETVQTVRASAPFRQSEISVVQIPVQQASESARTELRENEKSPQFAGSDESLQVAATALLPKRGLEPPLQVTETRT